MDTCFAGGRIKRHARIYAAGGATSSISGVRFGRQ
jgi:hypothetical protein